MTLKRIQDEFIREEKDERKKSLTNKLFYKKSKILVSFIILFKLAYKLIKILN